MEIKEAYCSFEVSKLLKEKGFDDSCLSYFWSEGIDTSYTDIPFTQKNMYEGQILRPTHQMAMKWLREIHKIHIEIWPTYNMETEEHTGWGITVTDLSDFGGVYLSDAGSYKTYEEAVEVALKTSLENFV